MAEISEAKKAEIQKQAKQILDDFSKALDGVEIKKKEFKKQKGGFREEDKGCDGDPDFRVRMFDNAPSKNEDCIIAETKSW